MGDVHVLALPLASGRARVRRKRKKKKEERNVDCSERDPKMLSTFRAVLLLTMTMTMQCHMTTKTFPVAGSSRSHSIKSRSSPSPRNAEGAMHPMIKREEERKVQVKTFSQRAAAEWMKNAHERNTQRGKKRYEE